MRKLLIVESPTKAKTIKKFLGGTYDVVSSFGHIRDLPKRKMGIDFEHAFQPEYVVPTDKKDKVTALKSAAKKADEVYLATDEDREGEAIAWHIAEILGIDTEKAKRITFHEITKQAIEEALEHPRTISMPLVDAQQTRRILDRIVGYELSPFLWKKVQRGLSAGRVQSVAVRLIVERERERKAFKEEEYWTIDGIFNHDAQDFEGKLSEKDGKKVKKLDIKTESDATGIVEALNGKSFTVRDVEKKQASKKPPTPFRTSVLQQEANNKLGFSAKQTMSIAQKLYETGRITYMRTDSLNLSEKFLAEAQDFIGSEYGSDYAKGPSAYKTKSKGAQEAHEAIRPTDVTVTPESIKAKVDARTYKLYKLIWSRTVASQMPSAKLERTGIDLEANGYTFRASGSVIVFDGFMKVYRSAKEKFLPELTKGDTVEAKSITPTQHFTQPPPRYSDATLIKVLEEHGIGRPSTYAPTISTIINRGYIDRDDNKKLAPTDIAEIVNDVLVEHFSDIVDTDFTAHMEKSLDEIAEGKIDAVPMLKAFYEPFHTNIENKVESVSRDDVMPERELGNDPATGLPIILKTGRFGPYVQVGEYSKEDAEAKKEKPKRASVPKQYRMDDVTLELALTFLSLPKVIAKTKTGEDIELLIGPYGPYLKSGKTNVGLPEDVDPFSLGEAEAKDLFDNEEKRKKEMAKPIATLGKDPESGGEIEVKNGRYGPYVTDGKTNASIPKSKDPKEITTEIAIEMLAKKRNRKGGYKKKA